MAIADPRLAWSLVFAPRRPEGEVPAWPELVARLVGAVHMPHIDPMARVLRGPLPVGTLARGSSEAGVRFVLSGVGHAATLTLVDKEPGEIEGHLRLERMRARFAATLLGLDVPEDGGATGLEATPERMGTLLGDVFGAEPEWELLGITEVCASLSEGVPEDAPRVDGFGDVGDLRIARATGIGQGHAAFTLTGFHTLETARLVMERRLDVLTQGHQTTVPPFADYGAHALTWGRAAASGLRLSQALAGVVADVRVAASWAVTGGPLDDGPPRFDLLAARLEMLRVRLQEVIAQLRRSQDDLTRAARRILGDGAEVGASSPFPEASSRGSRLADRLAEEEQMAARWAEALTVARRAVPEGQAG